MIDQILATLKQVYPAGNWAVFTADAERNYYVQVHCSPLDHTIYCEAVGKALLTRPNRLKREQALTLIRLGWDTSAGNFERTWNVTSQQSLEVLAVYLACSIDAYGVPADRQLDIKTGELAVTA